MEEFWETSPAYELLRRFGMPCREEAALSSMILDGRLYSYSTEGGTAQYVDDLFPGADADRFACWNRLAMEHARRIRFEVPVRSARLRITDRDAELRILRERTRRSTSSPSLDPGAGRNRIGDRMAPDLGARRAARDAPVPPPLDLRVVPRAACASAAATSDSSMPSSHGFHPDAVRLGAHVTSITAGATGHGVEVRYTTSAGRDDRCSRSPLHRDRAGLDAPGLEHRSTTPSGRAHGARLRPLRNIREGDPAAPYGPTPHPGTRR